jgi:hypothetical protein
LITASPHCRMRQQGYAGLHGNIAYVGGTGAGAGASTKTQMQTPVIALRKNLWAGGKDPDGRAGGDKLDVEGLVRELTLLPKDPR